MKTFRGRIFIGAGILSALCVVCLLPWRYHKLTEPSRPAPVQNPVPEKETAPHQPKAPRNLLNVKMTADFTQEEKNEFAKKFEQDIKPAVEKWFKAYEGRVPIRPGDLTLDQFYSRMGKNASFYVYTFVIGDTTLTVQESDGKFKVNYLMSHKAGVEMISSPSSGFVPNLTVPITRDDTIRMVKADTGVQFKPNEVIIKPTAAACALNGGAFVYVIPTGADPNNGLSRKVDMVFGSDGNLVYYMRDPFF
jgi:hypothetical protein